MYIALKGYRKINLLSQASAGKLLNITRESYCSKELGKTEFTMSEVNKLMKKFKEKMPTLTIEEVFIRK